MKKSLAVIGILILVILCEITALWYKSKNPEPTVFALAEREYNLPAGNNTVENDKIAPLVFETDFVEKTDVILKELENEADDGFAVHLTHIFNRMAQAEQDKATAKLEKKKKLDEFRQAMAAEPVAVRGTYVGDNICEVDGVRGICADGVYQLGKHCIACYEGICAGTTCAAEVVKAETEEAAVIYSEDMAEDSAQDNLQPVAEVMSEDKDDSFINEVLGENVVVLTAETAPVAVEESANDVMVSAEDSGKTEEIKPEKAVETTEIKTEETVKSEEKIVTENKQESATPPQNGEVLIAVVIDDIGLSVPFTNQIATIGQPITVSFLPYGASNKEQVNKLRNAGLEVMLHAPMMPRVPADLAPVTLSPKMSKAEIQKKLLKMMDRFDGTGMHGINNHMGSAFTEDRAAMAAVMEVLQERGMYFLDSKTTSRSVGRAVSKEYGVPYVARDVFLDNERRYDYIMGQFKATERVAKSKGYAIAIGHPYPQTLQALKDWLKDIEKRGIKIVPLSDLVAKTN